MHGCWPRSDFSICIYVKVASGRAEDVALKPIEESGLTGGTSNVLQAENGSNDLRHDLRTTALTTSWNDGEMTNT